ncbi:MAG: hypothetical protein GXY94_01395 [Bacteroidales bacterium]|nr:hypothetical protein [Bacteroidales bacterium]
MLNKTLRTRLSFQLPRLIMLIVLMAFMGAGLSGQGFNANDLSRLRSSDISDAQLQTIIDRGEQEGISAAEAINLAKARGLSPSVANELLKRAETLQSQADKPVVSQQRLRKELVPAKITDAANLSDTLVAEEMVGPQIFGSSLFGNRQSLFEPAMNIPTPLNYVLGAGDELIIDIWGATTNFYQLQVGNEGSVTIDNVGPVYVHGLTMEEAEAKIIEKLKLLYRGLRPGQADQTTYASVSLGRVRSIQVTIIGEVKTPVTYTVSSLSTVFNALHSAGGPGKIGSYRQIELIRDNRIYAVFDLYDMLLRGDQSGNLRLNDQDVVRVATIKNRVEVAGHVRRPALYEVKDDETLAQLIEFSGSFNDSAYTRQVKLIRNSETERMLITVPRSAFDSFLLANGDVVQVDKILDRFSNRVTIEGAVWRPGDYELTEGMTLSQLIALAEGVMPDVFRGRGVINRLSDNYDFRVESFSVDKLLAGEYDLALKPEDQVIIRSIHDMREERTIQIGGEVKNAGLFQFREGMTLEDLILMASGFKVSASEARIEINRRILGEAAPAKRGTKLAENYVFGVDRMLTLNDEAKTFELQPFDQVYVRPRPDYQVQRSVRIEGEVLFPGEYTLSDRNERISDLVKRAGGLTDEAYIKGATMLRQSLQLSRVETEVDLGMDLTVEKPKSNENFVGIDLDDILASPGSEDDLFLRPGDEIRIPSELQTIRVSGGVLREAEIRYTEGKNLKYYVSRSGGYTQGARKGRAYVLYANGDVETKSRFLFFSSSPKIEQGAEIVVPQKVEVGALSPGERISILSTVVSMAAIVITAISMF